jgi:dihydroxy-acid dehydratase
MTVTGQTLGQELSNIDIPNWPQDIIRPSKQPIYKEGGLAVLYGNLAPQGAIIKQAAASQHLLSYTGRAVVFANMADLAARIDSPDLDVSQDDILVLRQIGPKGAPGMPEAGLIPIPKKLAKQGVKDMVRISDGRMSGTAAGTIILHVAPESAVGGPLSLVRTGDQIQLDVATRQLNMLVSDQELERRRAEQPAASSAELRGYEKLFYDHVLQAPDGVDFDFLQAKKDGH